MSLSEVKIVSQNVHGIRSKYKVKKLAVELRKHRCQIFLASDTHLDVESLRYLKNYIPEYDIYATLQAHEARGTAIFLHKKFPCEVLDVKYDPTCNYTIVKILFETRKISLISVYGPNTTNIDFYNDLFTSIDRTSPEETICGGDWNLVMNFNKDRRGYNNDANIQNCEKVKECVRARLWVDTYRLKHRQSIRFSWKGWVRGIYKQARIDMIFSSGNLAQAINNASICDINNFSDHAACVLKFDISKIQV